MAALGDTMMSLLGRLRYHVTGAVTRGEATAIVGLDATTISRELSAVGAEYSHGDYVVVYRHDDYGRPTCYDLLTTHSGFQHDADDLVRPCTVYHTDSESAYGLDDPCETTHYATLALALDGIRGA